MKTERRHELQTNQLADSLARGIEAVKPYSRAALAVVLALIVLAFAWVYMANQNNRRVAQGWTEYFDALAKRDARDDLTEIATRYAGTPVAQWARLVLADIQLDDGTNRLFVEKKDARDELRQAAEKYRAVLLEARHPTLEQHATYGLARAHEALGTTESLEDARKEYRSIGEKWPDSAYAEVAAARAKDLDQLDTKNFYDWLAKYEPPKPPTNQPGQPGVRPDFLKDSLDEGVKLPSVLDGGTPPGTATAPSSPLGEPPGPLLPSSEGSTPEPPATDKPAETPEAAPESK
jgi:hypothetical protein